MAKTTFGPFQPFLEESFISELSRLKDKNPFSPISVIVPTKALRKRLSTIISERGSWINLHFFTFLGLSFFILKHARKVIPPIPPRATYRLLLREKIAEMGKRDKLAKKLFEYESYTDRLLSLFSHLTSHMISEEEREKNIEDTVFSAYRKFLDTKKSAGFLESEDIISLALEELKSRGSTAGDFPKTFILYGFYDLNPLQKEIVSRLDALGELFVFSPVTTDEPAAEYTRPTVDFFSHLNKGMDTKTHGPIDDEKPIYAISRRLFSPRTDFSIDTKDSIRIVTASGSLGETEAIAMEILREKENNPDLRWRDIGVVARDLSAVSENLKGILTQYSIPAFIEDGTPLRRYPEVRAFFSLIGAVETGLRRKNITTLLSSDYFSWPSLESAEEEWVRENSHLAEVIARQSRVISGPTQWKGAWRKETIDFEYPIGDVDEMYPEREKSIRRIKRFKSLTRETVYALIGDLTSIPDTATPKDYSDIFGNLFLKYIRKRGDSDPYDLVKEMIVYMADISNKKISLIEFIHLIKRETEDLSIPDPPDRDAVYVSDVMGIRGLFFDILIVFGMNEKVFPRIRNSDPLICETTRKRLGLPTMTSQYLEDKYLFALTIRTAGGRLILVYQRSDDSGRKSIPSIFLRELLSKTKIEDDRPKVDKPSNKAPTKKYRKDYPRLIFQEDEISKYREKDFRVSVAADPKDVEIARAIVSTSNFLRDGLVSRDARSYKKPFDIYDGVIGHHEELLKNLLPLTAKKLETYSACPFRFFMEYVLGVREIEEATEEEDIEAIEMGSAYHRVLTHLFRTLKSKGMLPLTESDVDTASDLLQKIVIDEVSKKFKGLILDLVLRAREESIKENLKELIDREAGSEKDDFIPTHFEKPFGTRRREESGGIPYLTLDIEGRELVFSGRIDRIDVNKNDKLFVVIDYKKKRPAGQRKLETEIEEGGHFQMPLYIMAARDVIFSGDYKPKEGKLVYIEWEDEKKRADVLVSDAILASIEKAIENIGEHVSQIEFGAFAPISKRENTSCRFCPYKDLCLSESRGTIDRREGITNR